MRIGFLSNFDRERIGFAQANGFGSVELIVSPETDFLPGNDGWADRAAEVKEVYDQADLRISCIGGFYVNHMDPDPDKAEAHRQFVRRTIELAEAMAVPVVAGFAGRVPEPELEKSLPAFKTIWSEHAKFAEDRNIKIGFEHCPMGHFHSPFHGINCVATPAMWDRCFDEVPSEALGLEWDPSHLVCQFIDPVENIRRYGSRIYHVHAKDAKVYHDVVCRYGIYHPGAIEHCFPGLGDSDWAGIIKELVRVGYLGDLNIEGWHDAVFRQHEQGPKLEDLGLLIARRHLAHYVDNR